MRPRNVLTQTNNMRKLMGLPLLNEDTGATAEDVKKKVLTEDRSFSLGFANNGGLTIAEEEVTEQEEKFKFYDPSTEEHEYWDDLADTDEESAYYDWFEDNEDRLYSARNIDNAGGYVVTNGADWDYFKTEWYNSDNYEKYIKTIERRQEKDNKKQGRKDRRDLNKKVRQGYKEKRKKEREERRGREEGDAEVDYWGVEVDAGINEGGLGLNTDAQVFAEQGALDANKEYEVKDKSGEVVGTYKSNRKPFAFRANPGTPYKDGDKIPEGLSMDTGWENWDYEKHKFKDKEEVDPHHPEPHRIKETTGGSFDKYNITLED